MPFAQPLTTSLTVLIQQLTVVLISSCDMYVCVFMACNSYK